MPDTSAAPPIGLTLNELLNRRVGTAWAQTLPATPGPMSVWWKESFNLCSHHQNKLWLAYKSVTMVLNKHDSVPAGLILI